MFTVETEFDKTVVTTIDDKGELEDVILEVLDDGSINVLQYNEYYQAYAFLHMSGHQWLDLLAAMRNTDGAYRLAEAGKHKL